LYEQPSLTAELRRLRTRYAAGQAAVVNPRVGSSHGDQAQALALAVWELRGAQRPVRISVPRGRLPSTDELLTARELAG
jgi:hypothetical protein